MFSSSVMQVGFKTGQDPDYYNNRGNAYKAFGKTKESNAVFAKAKSLEK